jgi:LAO/AO transport system kinase
VARALTRIERGGPAARELVRGLYPDTGRAHRVGVTGAPGTGKSTLVNVLAKELNARGRRVGIIAVDPSSPFSGGAILGDRLRMQDLLGSGVFIRSMASRGQLGGLAAAVSNSLVVMDAAGFETILVETVGAGQGEVDIARHAHTTIVLEAPGFGDEVQAIKAGVLEIADILVVNKADREGATATVAALEMNLNLSPEKTGWRPPVIKAVAISGEGVTEVIDALTRHYAFLVEHSLLAVQERGRLDEELRALVQRELLEQALHALPPGLWAGMLDRMIRRELDPYTAAHEIMESIPRN